MAARIELTWGTGDSLAIAGSGFRPNERIMLTLAVRSQGATVRSGPGTFVQSSQSSSSSSTMTIAADAAGAFRMTSTVSGTDGTMVDVSAAGSDGSHAQARTTVSGVR